MSNEDYTAILLTYVQDVEETRNKDVNEDGGEYPNQWVDAATKVRILYALQYLREENLTFVGPLCKNNSPAHITDAVNRAYKSQLKANHHLGKGISFKISSLEMIMDKKVREVKDNMTFDDSNLTALERTNGDLKRKVGTLESTISNLTIAQ